MSNTTPWRIAVEATSHSREQMIEYFESLVAELKRDGYPLGGEYRGSTGGVSVSRSVTGPRQEPLSSQEIAALRALLESRS